MIVENHKVDPVNDAQVHLHHFPVLRSNIEKEADLIDIAADISPFLS